MKHVEMLETAVVLFDGRLAGRAHPQWLSVWRVLLILLISLGSSAPAQNGAGPQGIIVTVAGSERVFHGDGEPATEAGLGQAFGVTVGPSGDIYVADQDNSMVMKISSEDGKLTVVVGNGIWGFSRDFSGDDDDTDDTGLATKASLNGRRGGCGR